MDAIVPPSLDDVPANWREDLRNLQLLDDDALWAVARSRLASTQRARLEVLMTRHIVSLATERGDTDKCRPVYVCTGVCYRLPVVLTGHWLAQDFSLNLLNQEGQVGTGEAQIRRRDAVTLDIRRNVFMMRVGTGKRRIAGMRKRIVPVTSTRPKSAPEGM